MYNNVQVSCEIGLRKAMLQQLNWPTLEDHYRASDLILTYKVVNSLVAVPETYHTPRSPRYVVCTRFIPSFTKIQGFWQYTDAILLQHVLAILPQYCGDTGFHMQISFWQFCCNNPFWQYCDNTAKTIHKSSSGNIAAILPENIFNLIC